MLIFGRFNVRTTGPWILFGWSSEKKLGGVPLIRENTNNQSNLKTFTLEEP